MGNSITIDNESGLLDRSKSGDPDAFEQLLNTYYDLIYGIIYKHCGCAHDTEDILQESFIKAAHGIRHYRGEASFKNWLCKIALNHAEDHRRKSIRRNTLLENYQYPENASSSDPRSDQIDLVLQKLKPKERSAILLVFEQGLSHAEAAEICGCSETTISWRIFMGKQKIKGWLSKEKSS
jgi:RNA polymerase sigma-70 factor (ECF subfamily)